MIPMLNVVSTQYIRISNTCSTLVFIFPIDIGL